MKHSIWVTKPPCLTLKKNVKKKNKSIISRRRRGLKKKIEELSVLCDVDALFLISHGDGSFSSWPEDHQSFLSIANKFIQSDPKKRKQHKNSLPTNHSEGHHQNLDGLGLQELRSLFSQVGWSQLAIQQHIQLSNIHNQINKPPALPVSYEVQAHHHHHQNLCLDYQVSSSSSSSSSSSDQEFMLVDCSDQMCYFAEGNRNCLMGFEEPNQEQVSAAAICDELPILMNTTTCSSGYLQDMFNSLRPSSE